MSLTLGALALLAGISAGTGLITSATNQAHSVANREDNQSFNSIEAQLQRDWQSRENSTARAFNAEEAQKQRDWEQYMSDTSYQRQRADLESAGYNPASIGITQGASTPSGAVASGAPVGSAFSAQSNLGFNANMSSNYFSQLMSSAIQYKMAEDRNFTNKVIAEMYTNNAKDMNNLTNATRKALANYHQVSRAFESNGKMNYFTDHVLR